MKIPFFFIEKKKGQHKIGYAYPSSPIANRLQEKRGCWYYEDHESLSSHSDFQSCIAQAAEANTVPTRWSNDHPLNRKFLSEEQKEVV